MAAGEGRTGGGLPHPPPLAARTRDVPSVRPTGRAGGGVGGWVFWIFWLGGCPNGAAHCSVWGLGTDGSGQGCAYLLGGGGGELQDSANQILGKPRDPELSVLLDSDPPTHPPSQPPKQYTRHEQNFQVVLSVAPCG